MKTSELERKTRLLRLVKKYMAILGIGFAYLIFVICTGWGIPCVFYSFTGFRCPACGVSRMLVSLVKLDLAAAFRYNPLLLVTSPILLFCLIYPDVKYALTGKEKSAVVNVLLVIEIALLLAFGVIRNLR